MAISEGDSIKVSIAMATYNGAKYINEQLKSIAEQTRKPDELIITDDCSTDETVAIINEFAEFAPFPVVVYCNERNLGYCENFNKALIKTTGDIVFLSDQDDVWLPKKIEYMLNIAERNPHALVVMNDAALTDSNLKEVGLTKIGQIRSAGISPRSFVMGCCCGIRRELLDICMPVPLGFKAHDGWINWFADGLDARVVAEKVLQYYRRHDNNESQFIANKTTKVKRYQAFIYAVRKIFDGDIRKKEQEQIGQLKLLVEAARRSLAKVSGGYRVRLQAQIEKTDNDIITLLQRVEVRQKWLLFRLGAVVILLVKGRYRNTSGIKSILRDLVG